VQFTNPAFGKLPHADHRRFPATAGPPDSTAPPTAPPTPPFIVWWRGRAQQPGGHDIVRLEHPHDVFVVPSWTPVTHHAQEESVLFSFSDRPSQKALGLWREQAPMI